MRKLVLVAMAALLLAAVAGTATASGSGATTGDSWITACICGKCPPPCAI